MERMWPGGFLELLFRLDVRIGIYLSDPQV